MITNPSHFSSVVGLIAGCKPPMVEVMRTYLYGPTSALQKKERGQTHHQHHHAHTMEAAENSSVSRAKYCRKLTGIQHLDVGLEKPSKI